MWSACNITLPTPFAPLIPHHTQVKLSLSNTAVRHNLYSNDFRISRSINSEEFESIVIRSKEQAEQLHFMLGQLLEKI